jgi:peptidoglycan/xylan/chitin deacetylase (PgdA/CDA1 family)
MGSHTRTHFDCGSQDLDALQEEIVGSKQDLETRIGKPVEYFSFPFGLPENISPQAAELASTTYPYIFSAFGGANLPAPGSEVKHLMRRVHPASLWDLELHLQGVLEPEPPAPIPARSKRLEAAA